MVVRGYASTYNLPNTEKKKNWAGDGRSTLKKMKMGSAAKEQDTFVLQITTIDFFAIYDGTTKTGDKGL